jgi:3-oxoadipate enol-lactonase
MNCKTTDGLNIFYEIQGHPESAETLVFLNGLTQSTIAWGLVTPFFKAQYRIILLDFIFQGDSDKKGEWRNFDTHARDVFEVLHKEKITTATIVGISYGSLVAQHFALLYPEVTGSLILISTFAHKTPYYEAIELAWWRALEKGGYNLMLDIMLPSVLSEEYFKNPLIPINKLKESRKELNQNGEAIFKLMRATRERPDYRKQLRRISAPTLIIQGGKDLLFPVHLAEEVQKNIKGSQLKIISNAGHTLNLEHVRDVCELISDFLASINQRKS